MPMLLPGGDSAAAVTPAQVRQMGAKFWCRYLAPYPSQAWKIITIAETKALRDAGIPIVFNWESDGTPGNGFATGADAARQAQAQLDDRARALGDPSLSHAPVVFTFADVDVAQASLPLLIDAHKGAASVLGLARCGGYGGIAAIRALLDAGVITYAWQTYGWSRGQWDQRAQLRQCRNSLTDVVAHDYDEAWAVDYGQWPRPAQGGVTPNAETASLVGGAIGVLYDRLGGAKSFLGKAMTPETACPDGVGRFNHFEGGSIYWTRDTGAHEVHGAIRDAWAAQGWETGDLGYPVTDEHSCDWGAHHNFQGGSLYWDSNRNSVTKVA